VRRQDANLEIVVEDDGRGFEPSDVADRGLGLIGMRERAALLSGRIAFESGSGVGTRVDVRLPVSDRHV
jgi:two-component system sensor histidine kinase DegS